MWAALTQQVRIFRKPSSWQTACRCLWEFFPGCGFPKDKQKINDLCKIWINSVVHQLGLERSHFSALRNISAFSALSQWASCHAGFIFESWGAGGSWSGSNTLVRKPLCQDRQQYPATMCKNYILCWGLRCIFSYTLTSSLTRRSPASA